MTLSNTYKYWLSIFIGFAIVCIAYKYNIFNIEKFDSIAFDATTGDNQLGPHNYPSNTSTFPSPSSSSSSSVTSSSKLSSVPSPGPGPGPGQPVAMPYLTNLLLYFNSFNIKAPTNLTSSTNNTYNGAMSIWYDSINNASMHTTCQSGGPVNYFLNGPNVPASIDNTGLLLNNIMIQGPPSIHLTTASTNYALSSFSAVFYLTIQSLHFDTDAEIILFEMFAQTPNMIRLSVAPIANDTSNIEVNAYVGSASTVYAWKVPISTFISNGNTTLYSLVFNNTPTNPTVLFYIGTLQFSAKYQPPTPPSPIILAMQQMQINTNRNLNAYIIAFAYYNIALSQNDIITINNYYIQEASSINLLSSTLTQVQANLTAQNNDLLDQLNLTALQAKKLQNQLTALQNTPAAVVSCPATVSAPAKYLPPAPQWQINMNGTSSISDSDLEKCSPLTLNGINVNLPPITMPNIMGAPASSPSPAPTHNGVCY